MDTQITNIQNLYIAGRLTAEELTQRLNDLFDGDLVND